MALDRSIQLKVSLTDTELLRILRDRAAELQGKRPYRLEKSFSSTKKSDVVACFDPTLDSVTLTGLLSERRPIRFTLKPNTKTYHNFIRLFLRELQALATADALLESVAVGADAARAVAELTLHLEEKLRYLGDQHPNNDASGPFIDVFSADLETGNGAAPPVVARGVANRVHDAARGGRRRNQRSLLHRVRTEAERFRIVEHDVLDSQHISGFLSVEIEEFTDDPASRSVLPDVPTLAQNFALRAPPRVNVTGRRAQFVVELDVSEEMLPNVEFGLHWGAYDRPWWDEEVSEREIHHVAPNIVEIRKTIVPDSPGFFGASFWVAPAKGGDRHWLAVSGNTTSGDTTFETTVSASPSELVGVRSRLVEQSQLRTELLRALESFETFVRTAYRLIRGPQRRHVYRELFEVTRGDAALRQLVSEYFQRVIVDLEQKPSGLARARLQAARTILQNLGIGEVVFVTPEGPHAIAGGLAQVIVGLSTALAKQGLSTTIISPLYEEAQGNKHRSAEDILTHGVSIGGRVVIPQELGEVRIPFGPTKFSGTENFCTPPRVCIARVYCAESESVRIFFLRHHRLADRLYAAHGSDDQLRRAVFLSRGTLELIRDRRFGISPHVLLTNDWISALVPVFLRVDPRYQGDPGLQGVESIHLIHNCGRDYQGRFFTNQFGVDLFPMLGMSGEHYLGLSDPADVTMINLTAGAIFHAGRGIVAVSKPYAEQLLTDEGGENLQHLFRRKADALFGISNGIDVDALRALFWKLGDEARIELGTSGEACEPALLNGESGGPDAGQAIPSDSVPMGNTKRSTNGNSNGIRPSPMRALKRIPLDKAVTKNLIQRKYGLKEDPNAIILSMVGRLTEQKGIQLLSGCPVGATQSVMERVLARYENVQVLVGGPPTLGDFATQLLSDVVRDLEQRYPGRVKAVLSFIPHQDALEMTLGSDLFLMPSRFEPGGITQLEALACGTVVVARRVGGLAATLIDSHQDRERGNSFLFSDFTCEAFESAIFRALQTLSDETKRRALVRQALLAQNDWGHRAPKYVSVLQHVVGVLTTENPYPYLAARRHLLASVRAERNGDSYEFS